MKRKTYHLVPEKNFTHLSDYCRNPACVYGFIDHFEGDDEKVTTTVCAVCKPDTYDYLMKFPNVGERTENVLNAMQAHRARKGAKNDF
jgi:hypothetical protein